MSERRQDTSRSATGAPDPSSGSARRPRPGSPADESQLSDEERQARLQRQLDEALADSFPASDPVSIVTSQREED